MSDPLDELKAAMSRATPAPDPARKRAALDAAEKEFARAQGSAGGMRPTSDRPDTRAAFGKGFGRMLSKTLSSRGALAAGTALVAVGLVLVLPVLQQSRLPEVLPADGLQETAADDAPVAPGRERMATGETDAAVADSLPPGPPPVLMEAEEGFAAGAPMPLVEPAPMLRPAPDTEAFANAEANPLKVAAEEPVSTFSASMSIPHPTRWCAPRSSPAACRLKTPCGSRRW
jgi:Ca-activated chloride channel family protein